VRKNLVLALLASGLLGGNCNGPESIVPGDYASRFVRVRNCRGTIEHAGTAVSFITVYVNPESALQYQANANPLPANTIVVKEEHDDPACNELTAWSVMKKEPGYDSAHGDWYWQRVMSNGSVVEDGQVERCINCHEHPECLARDWMCTEP
jgi:hypothetical protein